MSERRTLSEYIEQQRESIPDRGAMVLAVLAFARNSYGRVSQSNIEEIAIALSMTNAEVLRIASFFSEYTPHERKGVTIEVCTNIGCAVNGGYAVLNKIAQRLDVTPGTEGLGNRPSVVESMCLGECGAPPAVRIGETTYAGVRLDDVDDLLREYELIAAAPDPETEVIGEEDDDA